MIFALPCWLTRLTRASLMLGLSLLSSLSEASALPLLDDDLDALQLMHILEDDPVSLRESIALDWQLPLATQGQVPKIAAWSISLLFGGMDAEVNLHCDQLKQAHQYAEQHALDQTWILMTIYFSSYKVCGYQPEAYYAAVIAKAEAKQLINLQVFAGGELGLTLAENGIEKGFAYLEAANQLARQTPGLDSMVHDLLRGYSAAILGLQGEHDKSVALQMELIRAPSLQKYRYQKSAMLFNMAMDQLATGGAEGIAKTKETFVEARRLGEELRDEYLIAMIDSAYSLLAIRDQRYHDAEVYAQQSLAVLERLKNQRWSGIALMRLTNALIALKKYDDALASLAKADRYMAPDDLRAHAKIEAYYSLAYEGQGKLAEALAHERKHFEINTRFNEQIAEQERQKQMASLELEISETRNRELQKTNELQAERLLGAQRLQKFMLALAAGMLVICVLLAISVVQTIKAHERKRKMRRILDHIDEGIMTIDGHLHIEAEYSRYLQFFLQEKQDLTGLDALDTLLQTSQLSEEQKSMIRETLKVSLGETSLAWELNEDKLPREVIYAGEPLRYAVMHWVPIFDRHDILQSVLVGIRDVSAERLLQAEVVKSKARSLDLQKELAEILDAGVHRVAPLIERTRKVFDALGLATQRQAILPEIHTIKGIARGLGLQLLSAATHDLESRVKLATAPGSDPYFQDVLQGYEQILTMFHVELGSWRGQELRVLPDALHRVLPGFLEQLNAAGLRLAGLLVDDRVGQWDLEILETLPDVLLHALTNSADHGFILPRAQGLTPDEPIFELRAVKSEAGSIELTLQDNGVGLNRQRVEAIAREKNFQAKAEQEIWDVLLMDEVSTAEILSRTSGRGIGLSAIQSKIAPWAGCLRLRPSGSGHGTVLKVVFAAKSLAQTA